MRTYILSHVSDAALLRDLDALVAHERGATAAVLAHVAEVDARRLYLPQGFPSMYEYCVRKLRLSEQAAMKRIRAGRTARRFPAIFEAVAEGRLHLSAVVLLTPHLTPDNAAELVAAAACQTMAEIERLLSRRSPKPDVPARIEPIPPQPLPSWDTKSLSLRTVESVAPQLSPGTVGASAFPDQLAPGPVATLVPRPNAPLSPGRFALQFTIDQGMHDKLRYVQALLSHRLPSGDVARVFDLALDALVSRLEKQKFAATAKPRPRSRRSSTDARHIPAHVKRAVWQRDQGQCTFVGERGQRCGSCKFLEFDHQDSVARGGQTTAENVRLRCRAHNQFEAERTFGAGFMSEKRIEARRAAAEARARAPAARQAPVSVDSPRAFSDSPASS